MRRFIQLPFAAIAVQMRGCATHLYTDSHEWVTQKEGEVTIGISKYAQENLGDVVFVSLPQVGDNVVARDVVAEVESVKATSNVYSPVEGTVSAVNEALKDQPGLINRAPETDGWIVRVKTSEVPKDLMNAEEYKKFLE